MKRSKHGFTLIELLVVIAIIGMLSSVVLASLNSARAKARDAKRMADIKQLKTALEFYFDTQDAYPSLGSDGTGYVISGLSTPLGPYLPAIPTDPSGTSWHTYRYVRGPSTAYGLYVRLENGGYCKTGVNINNGWWGSSVPVCSF